MQLGVFPLFPPRARHRKKRQRWNVAGGREGKQGRGEERTVKVKLREADQPSKQAAFREQLGLAARVEAAKVELGEHREVGERVARDRRDQVVREIDPGGGRLEPNPREPSQWLPRFQVRRIYLL